MLLEVCANSFQSAKNAQDASAHRIELCENLEIGGVTPSQSLLKQVSEELNIPAFILIRPRGGDFVYSKDEFEVMKSDILICKQLGFNGIVSGVLNTDLTIDIERTAELIALSKPLEFTFHRAFDELTNPVESLEQLVNIGANRILTSGQEDTAAEGIHLINTLNHLAKKRIIIMAGSGINADNALRFKSIGLKEIHGSASVLLSTNNSDSNSPKTVSDISKIRAILNAVST
jgi:copper homeostasis protein